MGEQYPVLKKDAFFGKFMTSSGPEAKIRNTTTGKDFKPNPATIALLDLCTGTRTVDEIATYLCQQTHEPPGKMADSVDRILKILQEKDLITMQSCPSDGPRAKEITVKYPLESAQIEITNRCNLSCLHCVNNSGKCSPDELTTEEIFSLLDTLSSMGATRILLTGGEPLMHPDLFRIVEHARREPMSVDIFTNGTLVTEEHVEKFRNLGVNGFLTSIDSNSEQVHDTFRGQEGALKKTLNAVRLLREAGFPVSVNLSIVQLNKDHFIDILGFFRELDITDYKIAPIKFSGRGVEGVAISPEEFYSILLEQFHYYEREFPGHKIPKTFFKPEGGCGIAQDNLLIKADGTVLPCHGCIREMGVGNIRNTDLTKLWETNEMLEVLRAMRVEDDDECFGCRYVSFCDGCIANAFIIKRRIQCRDLYTCAHYRAYEDVFGLGTGIVE